LHFAYEEEKHPQARPFSSGSYRRGDV
jgi:hypothetical protein